MIYIKKGISKENADYLYSHESIIKLKHDDGGIYYIEHPYVSYYSAFIDNIFVGAFLVIEHSSIEAEVHLHLLPESIKYYRNICYLMLHELFTIYHRVTGKIYGTLKTMQNMVKKLGFKHEGTMREAYSINDRKIDCEIYGLLKSEWGGLK